MQAKVDPRRPVMTTPTVRVMALDEPDANPLAPDFPWDGQTIAKRDGVTWYTVESKADDGSWTVESEIVAPMDDFRLLTEAATEALRQADEIAERLVRESWAVYPEAEIPPAPAKTDRLPSIAAMYGDEVNPISDDLIAERDSIRRSVDWADPDLATIVRFRLLTDAGFPAYDVSYCWGRTTSGELVDVDLPFGQLPKATWKTYLVDEAKRAGVNAKRLGFFDALSTLR